MNEEDVALKVRVADATRALAAGGEQDMVWGHIAVRDPNGRGVWMKAPGWGFDEISEERVQLVDWQGTVVHGTGKPHIECHIHLSIMMARPDVMATAHTHSAAVNSFSSLRIQLQALSHDGVLFAGENLGRSDLSGDLVANKERGAQLAADLGDRVACLMPRHGLVSVGATEAHAVMHAVLLSSACRIMLNALAAGTIVSWSDFEELRDKKAHVWPDSQIAAGYGYLVRRGRRLDAQSIE